MASVAATTPTLGPTDQTDAAPNSNTRTKVYISNIAIVLGAFDSDTNALVVGDLIDSLLDDDLTLTPSGSATQETKLDGTTVVSTGDTTYGDLTFRFAAPSSNAKVNLMLLKSDAEASGINRTVNINIQNFDGAIDKAFFHVNSAKAVGVSSSGVPVWQVTGTPFGVKREILAVPA